MILGMFEHLGVELLLGFVGLAVEFLGAGPDWKEPMPLVEVKTLSLIFLLIKRLQIY
jgi:hypothetical protein